MNLTKLELEVAIEQLGRIQESIDHLIDLAKWIEQRNEEEE